MDSLERGIGDVFRSFDSWLVSTGATDSVMRLAWAVLSVLWLGHVAVSTRPGRDPDLVGAFARLLLAGGLLSGVGGLTRVVLLGFETFRSAGAAVLNGLIGQTWGQFVQETLVPQFGQMLQVTDNAGETDEHRAINYITIRYPEVYKMAAKMLEAPGPYSLTKVSAMPASVQGVRKVVDVIFQYEGRETGEIIYWFCKVDVTGVFPFLVRPLSRYYPQP